MDTAQKVIDKALSKIGVKILGVSVSADQYTDAIESLNDMMTSLDGNGINLGYSIVSAKEDSVTIPDFASAFVKSRLALKLASDYNITAAVELQNEAKAEKKAVLSYLVKQNLGKGRLPSTLPLGGSWISGEARYPADEDIDAVTSSGNYLEDEQGFKIAGPDQYEESN